MLDEKVKLELYKPELQDISFDEIKEFIRSITLMRSKYTDELHLKEISIYEELAESLFDLRLSKVIEGQTIKGFDSIFFEIIIKIRKFYINLLTGKYNIYNEKILCRVEKAITIDNFTLNPGDIIITNIENALKLTMAGFINPIETNITK
ncbi:MAG: hypothetical protein QXV69_04995 [Sulfolobaceae archaeon]